MTGNVWVLEKWAEAARRKTGPGQNDPVYHRTVKRSKHALWGYVSSFIFSSLPGGGFSSKKSALMLIYSVHWPRTLRYKFILTRASRDILSPRFATLSCSPSMLLVTIYTDDFFIIVIINILIRFSECPIRLLFSTMLATFCFLFSLPSSALKISTKWKLLFGKKIKEFIHVFRTRTGNGTLAKCSHD